MKQLADDTRKKLAKLEVIDPDETTGLCCAVWSETWKWFKAIGELFDN